MRYKKPCLLHYRLAQMVCWSYSQFVFRPRILRNEIRDVQGPYVVIANHQAAYDFVNLITLTKRPMSFVISNSFYSTLPIAGFMEKMGVIPKQQFQTTVEDMKNMKAVTDTGQPLVIYPAGLMCENGLCTPIPSATYKFLKWLNVDVYVARTKGTYFAMPKWGKGVRPGRTYLDVYRLMSAEELSQLSMDEVRQKTDEALLFDAYEEQEELRVRYAGGRNIAGLENVLYMCPCCGEEHTMRVRNRSTIFCTACGYEQTCDEYGFLHNEKGQGPELRHVSDWSRMIQERLLHLVEEGQISRVTADVDVQLLDYQKHKFVDAGQGSLTLEKDRFVIQGQLHGEQTQLEISAEGLPALPCSPGRYLEIQEGKTIYRCVFRDGNLVMKFIDLLKIFYQLRHTIHEEMTI